MTREASARATVIVVSAFVLFASLVGCGGEKRPVSAAGSSTTISSSVPRSTSVRPSPTTRTTRVSATTTTTLGLQPAGEYRVLVEERDWVDHSRGRVLTTRLFIPASRGTASAGSFPLFVWAHGIGATVDYFAPLLSAWAAHGFVVAAPTFPRTRAGAPGGSDYDDYVNQPADVSFVISQVFAADGPNGNERPGLVDPTRIAVGGHSLGAVTTMGLVANRCCIDARVRAAVEVDGSPLRFPNGMPEQRGVPVLLLHGNTDDTFSVTESRATYAASVPPKYLAVMSDTPHTAFKVPRVFALMIAMVSDFLDAYLRDDAAATTRLLGDANAAGFVTFTHAP